MPRSFDAKLKRSFAPDIYNLLFAVMQIFADFAEIRAQFMTVRCNFSCGACSEMTLRLVVIQIN
jgi:hypothetical protein